VRHWHFLAAMTHWVMIFAPLPGGAGQGRRRAREASVVRVEASAAEAQL
jgi:hypothetical protein